MFVLIALSQSLSLVLFLLFVSFFVPLWWCCIVLGCGCSTFACLLGEEWLSAAWAAAALLEPVVQAVLVEDVLAGVLGDADDLIFLEVAEADGAHEVLLAVCGGGWWLLWRVSGWVVLGFLPGLLHELLVHELLNEGWEVLGVGAVDGVGERIAAIIVLAVHVEAIGAIGRGADLLDDGEAAADDGLHGISHEKNHDESEKAEQSQR
mmetsp:Transcript_3500/g.9314  ORF Transcript_3500/g.9314 Transcript_3500/m.9314 type:complete len:207 (+) Transcript_3500:164-784(+)